MAAADKRRSLRGCAKEDALLLSLVVHDIGVPTLSRAHVGGWLSLRRAEDLTFTQDIR